MTTELLPCPFCGSSGQIGTIDGLDAIAYCSNIDCPAHEILACGPSAWNTRALPSSPDEKSAQAATAVNTAEGVLRKVLDVLDGVLGDTDPFLPPDFTDDDVRDERPVFWCYQQLHALRQALASPPAFASMSAGVTDALLLRVRSLAICEDVINQPVEMAQTDWQRIADALERARANTRAGVETDWEAIASQLAENLRDYIADEIPQADAEVALRMYEHARAAGDAKGAGWPGSEKVTDDMEPNL